MLMMKRIMQNKILVLEVTTMYSVLLTIKEETYFRGDTLIINTGK